MVGISVCCVKMVERVIAAEVAKGIQFLAKNVQKYKITAEYEGETSRNPYSRGLEHQRDL